MCFPAPMIGHVLGAVLSVVPGSGHHCTECREKNKLSASEFALQSSRPGSSTNMSTSSSSMLPGIAAGGNSGTQKPITPNTALQSKDCEGMKHTKALRARQREFDEQRQPRHRPTQTNNDSALPLQAWQTNRASSHRVHMASKRLRPCCDWSCGRKTQQTRQSRKHI